MRVDPDAAQWPAATPLREVTTAAQDVPGSLRRLAAAIEAGEWGDVRACAVLMLNEPGVHCFGYGRDGTLPMTALMCQNIIIAAARGLDR